MYVVLFLGVMQAEGLTNNYVRGFISFSSFPFTLRFLIENYSELSIGLLFFVIYFSSAFSAEAQLNVGRPLIDDRNLLKIISYDCGLWCYKSV